MNLGDLLRHTRCDVLRDDSLPSLWTDSELVKYLNDAQADFARRTHCLHDDTSAFTTFTTVVGQADYPLDKRIVLITEMGIVDTNAETGAQSWFPLRDGTRSQVRKTFTAGRPTCQTAQVARRTVRLSPVPDAEYVVMMNVARKPLYLLSNNRDEPEIDEDYQLALCDYAAWRALANNSPEGANMASGDKFRQSYDLQVRDAKRDIARLWAGVAAQARGNWTGKRR